MRSVFVKWERQKRKNRSLEGQNNKKSGKLGRQGEVIGVDIYKRYSRADYCYGVANVWTEAPTAARQM